MNDTPVVCDNIDIISQFHGIGTLIDDRPKFQKS